MYCILLAIRLPFSINLSWVESWDLQRPSPREQTFVLRLRSVQPGCYGNHRDQTPSVQRWMYSDQTTSVVCLHCIITHTLASHYHAIIISLSCHYHLIIISLLHSVQRWMYSDQMTSAVCHCCIITHTLASHYHLIIISLAYHNYILFSAECTVIRRCQLYVSTA